MGSVHRHWRQGALLLFAAPAVAAPPALELPIACEMGKACVVQNYVDEDRGPGAKDYRCGFLVYDGHKGTDIRVADLPAFDRGVAVVAAAPGRVRAIRDGMADAPISSPEMRSAVKGREAGNSVAIEHGDGWETQYAHMRRGSIAVRPGELVVAGQVLGVVGLSGRTEFPHLHFEVRREGRTVDPFVGVAGGEPCAAGREPLWSGPAMRELAYVPTGLLGAGLSGSPPRMVAQSARSAAIRSESAAIVFWVQVYGARAGDEQELRLVGPGGRVLVERRIPVARNLAQSLVYVGVKRREKSWPAGDYTGSYRLLRAGTDVVDAGASSIVK